MTNEDPVISAGRDAWSRVQDRARKSWADWVLIGHAIQIGRAHALEISGASTPFGKKYTAAMAKWLSDNGLDGVGQQVRWRLLQCMSRLADIEKWREGLQQEQRDRWHHPDSILMHYRRRQVARRNLRPSVAPRPRITNDASAHKGAKSIYWPGDVIKRAAMAIREARSTDCIVLARVALEAAIRDEIDVLELLPDAPRHRATSKAPADDVAHEAA